MSPSPVDELIQPLVVGRSQEPGCTIPKFHRVLRAHVGVECLLVCEGLDELKVVRSRCLAEQANVWTPASVRLSFTNESSSGPIWPTNWGSLST